MKFVYLLLSIVAVTAHAEKKIDDPLSTHLTGHLFIAELKPGYHFNEKAQNVVEVDGRKLEAKLQKKDRLQFDLTGDAFSNASASLYVCDDALTFCQPRHVQISGSQNSLPLTGRGLASEIKVNAHGFIEDDLAEAMARAKKEKKLIFADFAARWCPGCVRLETETFGTKIFRDKTLGFVKVHVDFDRFENSLAKEKYQIHSIPSMIAMTADGEEISRLTDYQPMLKISEFVSSVESAPLPFAVLEKRASSGDKAAIRLLGQRLYASERFNESIGYLEKLKQTPIELADARVQAARVNYNHDAKLKDAYIANLKNALAGESQTTRSIVWRTALLELLDKTDPYRQLTYDSGIALCDKLMADPGALKTAFIGDSIGEFTGYERLLLASDRADMISAYTDDPAAKQRAWEVVADIGKQAHIPSKATGPSMRYLIFLTAAHRYDEGEGLAKSLLAADPQNPEIQRRLLRIYNEEKKFDQAIELGKTCLPRSYGLNEVWATEQIAKAYIGAGKKQDAKILLQSFLSRPDLVWSSMEREHKSFETLRASLD